MKLMQQVSHVLPQNICVELSAWLPSIKTVEFSHRGLQKNDGELLNSGPFSKLSEKHESREYGLYSFIATTKFAIFVTKVYELKNIQGGSLLDGVANLAINAVAP